MRRAAMALCLGLTCIAGGPLAHAQNEPTPPGDEGEKPAQPPGAEEPDGPDEGGTTTPIEGVQPTRPDYSDVFVVPRRPVLKRRRVELIPTYNVSINNPVARQHGFGLMLNIYLSEAFFIGLEGTYYQSQLTDRYFLLGVNQRVLPSVNRYLWSALLDFGYVPFHGKFTFFGRGTAHWEVWISAGIGVFQTEIIPRDPANQAFSSIRIAGMLPGIGSRLWLSRWLAFDVYFKSYIFGDLLEPTSRTPNETGEMAKARGQSQLTFDLVFGVGFSIFLPPGFEYKTQR